MVRRSALTQATRVQSQSMENFLGVNLALRIKTSLVAEFEPQKMKNGTTLVMMTTTDFFTDDDDDDGGRSFVVINKYKQ